jgi:uncharacterized protein (DUF983 family)
VRPVEYRTRSRWRAILGQRCPSCLEGRVYAGVLRMHENCPACGHHFEREPGYFLGAMYFSYPLSLLVLGFFTALIHVLRPSWRLDVAVTVAVLPLLLCVPAIVRYSRVLWMHWDRPYE